MPHAGLTAAEVRERQGRGQVNRVRSQHWRTYGGIVVRNLATWFNALVVPSAIVLFQLGEYRGAVAVSGMMIVNTLIGLVQEIVAKARLDRLTLVAATQVHAVRDGEVRTIPADDVVQDDVLRLTVGEMIVADGEVLEASYLEVDEALLTGEADPVAKSPGDPLLAGSFCVAGEGLYQAVRVGTAVASQQIALEARQHRHAAGPIQLSIDKIVQWLSYVAIGLAVLYVVQYWVLDFSQTQLAQMVAATVTSMVPQGLVLTTTLAFTLGAIRLSRQGAVVQRLDAVEAMAAVDVLCLDKTGTLTTNRLQLKQLLALEPTLTEEQVRTRLGLFASASIDRTNKVLAALRAKLGERPVDKLDELPFKAKNRYSVVQVRDAGVERTLVLGAIEALRPFFETQDEARLQDHFEGALQSGLRLLLLAETSAPAKPAELSAMPRLRPLALLGLEDEVRVEAVTALATLAEQGIAFKIISGDNPHTVRATLKHFNLPIRDDQVISGDELAEQGTTAAVVERCCVFGRVSPHQKLDIITTLQQRGHFVAMVGDGVNDILSIKRADLGMAMGAGSTATKAVAGLVLLNNNFSLLPAAMQEARIALHNLRRAGKLFLTKNAYTLVIIAFALLFAAVPFPYLPQQVTLLNVLTIGLPALILTFGRTSGRPTDRQQFLWEVGGFAIGTGLALGLAGVALLAIAAYLRQDNPQVQRTLLLLVLIALSVQTTWRAVCRGEGPLSATSWILMGVSILAVPLYFATVYSFMLANFFFLEPPALESWLWAAGVVVPTMVLVELGDRHIRRSMPRSVPGGPSS